MAEEIKYNEEKIKSPIDGSNKCFRVYTEPLTEDYFLCLGSGFTTTSRYKIDSSYVETVRKKSPKIIAELEFFDYDRELVWVPCVLNMGKRGMIYPAGTKDNWNWHYAKVVEIPKEEKENFKIPGKEGKYYESRLDIDNSEIFNSTDFIGACISMGIIKDKDNIDISSITNG